MAIIVWGANAAFYIDCRLLLQCYTGDWALTLTWFDHRGRAREYFKSIPVISIMHLLYPSHSFARVGHLSNKPVQ